MNKRPKIGITMRLEMPTRRFYLGRDYCEAIEAAGGLPVHIPLIPKTEYISDLMDSLDGILLPGCDSDVDPKLYGEEPHPKLGAVIPEKDATDLMVLNAAEKRKLPILGICFGMQIINVWRGGSLIQDIQSQVEGPIKHEQGSPLDRNSHKLTVADGVLKGLCNSAESPIFVNSHHHQAIRNLGKGFRATAWAGDGIVECIEDIDDNHYILGVQWHPELSWATDNLSAAIFKTFVARCLVS